MRRLFLLPILVLGLLGPVALPLCAQEDEIVANLAGGRLLIHVAKDSIIFGAIEHSLEAKAVPPRVAQVDGRHLGIFFGASEWQVPSQPRPIRLDRDVQRVAAPDPRSQVPGGAEVDLEQIGVTFLEKLRPLVGQLHHKIDLKPDEPLVSIVVIGFAPNAYGPEVWLTEYRIEQQLITTSGDYWQTKILRPRFTQLYPPEKHAPRTLLEVRFPDDSQDIPLEGLIQQNDPRISRLRSADPRFAKVIELIDHGQAQKANSADATDFMRAALPLIAGQSPFVLGTMAENGGFEWIVPPQEPREERKQAEAENKNRPADAPTLMRKPKP